jgi:hypothetical protein
MNTYSILSVMAAVLFAGLAAADPGTKWDQKIDNPGRFKVLSQFKGEAVLDRETGRVGAVGEGAGDRLVYCARPMLRRQHGRPSWVEAALDRGTGELGGQ